MEISSIKKYIKKYNITLESINSTPLPADIRKDIYDYLTAENSVEKYANGEITYATLMKGLTPELFKCNKSNIDCAREYRNAKPGYNRNMQVIYITGASGTGKTTYAKYCANKYYKDNVYVSGNSSNPFDGYDMEKCIILDEFRSSSFRFNELLELLDNHTGRAQAARYHDVNMNNCELMFITSIYAPDVLYSNMMEKENSTEPKEQLYRRLGYSYWEIDKDGYIWEINLLDYSKKKLILDTEQENTKLAIENTKENSGRLFINKAKEEKKETKSAKVYNINYDTDNDIF